MPSPFDQEPYRVRLEWGPTGAAAVGAAATYAVVVDVLSFTTTLTVAADLGIEVLPFPWKDDSAAAYAREHGAALAVGRTEARVRAGGSTAVSLSPGSLRAAPGLRSLVLPSPNGSTTSFLLRDTGATVLGASLRNAGAVAAWLTVRLERDPDATVAVVAAGERWPDGSLRPAVEDLVGAGAVIDRLGAIGGVTASPEAAVAAAAYRDAAPRLRDVVRSCSSGRELVSRGFGDDVEVALELEQSASVPVLDGIRFTTTAGSEEPADG